MESCSFELTFLALRPFPRLLTMLSKLRAERFSESRTRIHTVEHVLAAVAGLRIDNLLIELTDEEPPAMDGSAYPFVEALRKAEIVEQDAERVYLDLEKTLTYRDNEAAIDIVIVPSSEFRVTYMIDYPNTVLGTQYTSMYSICEFPEEFAKARTFCLMSEMRSLKDRNLIQGGSLNNAVVFVDQDLEEESYEDLKHAFHYEGELRHNGPVLGGVELRYPNEPVRHKTLDLVGDLALVGAPIRGHVLAARAGHASHVEVAKMLRRLLEAQKVARKYGEKVVKDTSLIPRQLKSSFRTNIRCSWSTGFSNLFPANVLLESRT